jgi:flagellar hook protein FlgE
VTETGFNPIATSSVTLSANLPATPTPGTASGPTVTPAGVVTPASPLSSDITVYDSLGTAHTVTLNWVQNPTAANTWSVQIQVPDAVATTGAVTPNNPVTDAGTADVVFGSASGSLDASGKPPPEGTIGQITVDSGYAATTVGTTNYQAAPADPGTVSTSGYAAGQPATLQFTTNFGSGNQTIQLNLGTYGSATGVTQFAGTAYDLLGLTQNGVPPGSFSGVTTQANGDVQVNYNNGQTRTIAQVPLVTFDSPDSLQRQNGQAFTSTLTSGTPLAVAAGTNGSGNLVTSSTESSNVDIATEFSALIVAQQAYSSNAKVVTTASQMLHDQHDYMMATD